MHAQPFAAQHVHDRFVGDNRTGRAGQPVDSRQLTVYELVCTSSTYDMTIVLSWVSECKIRAVSPRVIGGADLVV